MRIRRLTGVITAAAFLILLGAMLFLSILCAAAAPGTEGIYVGEDTEVQTEAETEAEISEMTGAVPEDSFIYDVDKDGNVRIENYIGDESEVSIPAEIDGHPVTTIGNEAFPYYSEIKKILIPSSITHIEGNPFIGCEELTEFAVDEGQESFAVINGVLFEKSSKSLIACPGGFSGTFEVPEGTLTIGDYAFTDCMHLEQILIPDSVTKLGEYAFSGCTDLYEADLPDSASAAIDEISEGLFNGCESLYSIVLPSSVTRIGKDAFSYSGLSDVEIPDAVEEIGESAYSNCYNLYMIEIPGNVRKIGPDAFAGCTSLEEATMEEGVAEIGDYAFREAAVYEVSIPASVEKIGKNPFALCGNLTEISASVEQSFFSVVGNGLYDTASKKLISYCAGTYDETVVVPEGVESIGDSAFYSMEQITSVDFPSTLKEIGNEVFAYCTQLRSVSFAGNSLTAIGSETFKSCSSLGEIRIPNSCSSIGECCFSECTELHSVRLPLSLDKIDVGLFEYCENLRRANLPEVTVIESEAFYECNGLMTVNMPETVHTIGSYAFYDCPITEVTIPSSVSYINEGTFYGCSSLKKVTLPEQLKMICDIAFSNCTSLSEIVIPEGTVAIGDYAFSGCESLHSVNAPDSLKYIGSLAFEECRELRHMNLSDLITSPARLTEDDLQILRETYDPGLLYEGDTESGKGVEDASATSVDQLTVEEMDNRFLQGPGIAEDTFEGCPDLTLTVGRESYGKEYAITHGFDYNYPDSNDWLNM